MSENEVEKKKRWFDRTWAIRLLLIFLYPVGLYGFIRGAIRGAKKPIGTLIVTTLLYGGFWTLFIIIPATPTENRVETVSMPEETSEDKTNPISPLAQPKTINESIPPLYQAAEKGNLKEVQKLLKKGEKSYTAFKTRGEPVQNDDVEKDAYYIAMRKGYYKIAEEITKNHNIWPYWVNREDIITSNNTEAIIEYLNTHKIILPAGDVKTLINLFGKAKNNVEKQKILTILNLLAKIDESENRYVDLGIDLSPYLETPDVWEKVVFNDLKSLNQIAGHWIGLKDVYQLTPSDYAGETRYYARIPVFVSVDFKKNIKKLTDIYFEYYASANYDIFIDVYVDAVIESNPDNKKLPEKNELKKLVLKNLNTLTFPKEDYGEFKTEIKIEDSKLNMRLKINALLFKDVFSNSVYMNATKNKLKFSFPAGTVPVYDPYFEIVLDKK
ncbi:hypothetical protein [Treponema sp. R80B11-R83G3]